LTIHRRKKKAVTGGKRQENQIKQKRQEMQKGRVARGKRLDILGAKRHKARGRRENARKKRREARGKRQEARDKRQEARDKRQDEPGGRTKTRYVL
jgi:hypothetical protein